MPQWRDGRGEDEEEVSSADPDGQPNTPSWDFLIQESNFPNVIDVDWIQWNTANSFSSPNKALMALSLIFQRLPPQLDWLSAISAGKAVGGREEEVMRRTGGSGGVNGAA